MAANAVVPISFTPDELRALRELAEAEHTTPGKLIKQLARQHLQDALSGTNESDRDPVEFLLRPSQRAFKNPQWTDGGRWLLEWLLLSEPDWQHHHMTMLPRHWPIPEPGRREQRCHHNGGGDLGWSINDFIHEWRYPTEHPGQQPCLPADFPDLTREQWIEVTARFRGCCGERIRAPGDPHWDDVCV